MLYVLRFSLPLAMLLLGPNVQAESSIQAEPEPAPDLAFSSQPLPADHLECWSLADDDLGSAVEAVVNLNASQFGLQQGCKVGPARQFCVPASKSIVSSEIDTIRIHTEPQPGDVICYQLTNCPQPKATRDLHVADQFGKRTIKLRHSDLLCVPAVKIPVPTECGFLDGGICDGPCFEPNQTCEITLDQTGATVCQCVDTPPPPCGVDAANQCGGACEDPTTECRQDEDDDDFDVDCRCLTKPVSCEYTRVSITGVADTDFVCPLNGDCPDESFCDAFPAPNGGNICRCSVPCQHDASGQCVGECSGEFDGCGSDPDNPSDCICIPSVKATVK